MDKKYTAPEYYTDRKYEPRKVIEALDLSFDLGNAVKYIARAGKKDGNTFESDISKAIVYLGFACEYFAHSDYAKIKDQRIEEHKEYVMENIHDIVEDWKLIYRGSKTLHLRTALIYICETSIHESTFDKWRLAKNAKTELENLLGGETDASKPLDYDYYEEVDAVKIKEDEEWAERNGAVKIPGLSPEYDEAFQSGWNHALSDVIEYLNTAHGGDSFVGKSELVGHCDAAQFH